MKNRSWTMQPKAIYYYLLLNAGTISNNLRFNYSNIRLKVF